MKKLFTFLGLLCALYTVAAPPTSAPNNLTFTNIEGNAIQISFSGGNGTRRIVVVKQGAAVQGLPDDGVEYNANTAFGAAGTAFTGTGEFVVSKSNSTNVQVTNLQPNTVYHIAVFEYNGTATATEYLASPLRGNRYTANTPGAAVSSVTATNITGTTAKINWANGTGNGRLVIIRKTNAVNAVPQNLQRYNTSNDSYTTYNQLNGDNYAVYAGSSSSVSISNLEPAQLYHFTVYEYNGSSAPMYASGVAGSFTTNAGPTTNSHGFGTSYVEGNSFRFGFSAGNGSRRLVVMSKVHAITATPVNGQVYTAKETLGQGQEIAPDEFVVYNGTGTSTLPAFGLAPNGSYYLKIFDYDQNASGYTYYLQSGYAAIGHTSKTPTVPPSGFYISNIAGTAMHINMTRGNGDAYKGIVKEGSAVDFAAQDLTDYNVKSVFGTGQESGNGNYWTLGGNGSYAYVAGLQPGKTYHIAVYEKNGNSAPVYSTPGVFSFTVPERPGTQVSNLRSLSAEGNSIYMLFNAGNGSHRIVIARKGAPVTAVPVDEIMYTGKDSFGSGTEITPGNYVVYNSNSNNVNVKDLEIGTTYYFTAFEYNISAITGKPVYLTTNNPTAAVTTLAAPSVQLRFHPATNITTQSVRISYTGGNGDGRILIMRQTGAGGGIPPQLRVYSGYGSAFGAVPVDDQGNSIVMKDASVRPVDITNLRPNTTYTVLGYEYKGSTGPVYAIPADSIVFTTPDVASAPDLPTQPAKTGFASNHEGNAFKLQWTNGNGANRIVVMRKGSAVTFRPQHGDVYTANAAFGTGTNLGFDQYIVYNGTGNNVQISNLEHSTPYHYAVYEYNGSGTLTRYLTAQLFSASTSTFSAPAGNVSNVLTTTNGSSSISFEWINGNGSGHIVVMKEGSPVTFVPANLTAYTANRNFGQGNAVGGNQYVVYNGGGNVFTVTNLLPNKTYYYAIFEYNGNEAPVYNTTNNPIGSQLVNTILPVKWVSFTVKNIANNTVLNWVVAEEANVAGYEVEKSTDGTSFTTVYYVSATAAVNTAKSYQATVPSVAGSAYYRIKQTDKDGKSSYSSIVKLSTTEAPLQVNVYPNPATDFISLQLPTGQGLSQISIYTASGSKVIHKTFTATEKINVQQLSAGTYFIVVNNGQQSSKATFVKQ